MGRIEDARAMLEAGDQAFDFTADMKISLRDDRGRGFTSDRAKLRGHRDLLVRELRNAGALEVDEAPASFGADASQ